MPALLPAGPVVGSAGTMTRIAARISSVTVREVLDSRVPARSDRGDRVAKDNQLVSRKPLGDRAVYPGLGVFPGGEALK